MSPESPDHDDRDDDRDRDRYRGRGSKRDRDWDADRGPDRDPETDWDYDRDRGRRRSRRSEEDSDLSTGELVVAILCSGIGCLVGLIWLIQGKPKAGKMIGISLVAGICWNVLAEAVKMMQKAN